MVRFGGWRTSPNRSSACRISSRRAQSRRGTSIATFGRDAYAFDIDAVCYTSRKSAQLNNTVITSSAGAALKTNLVRISNVTNFIERLKDNKFWIYGSVVDPQDSEDLNNIQFDDRSAVLVGNEGKGLSDKVVKHCDFRVHIPVKFNSLNVSVATAIICNRIFNS